MLPINLISLPALADTSRLSPVSRTSLPGSKFAVSLDSIGKVFTISVVTLSLLWDKDTVCVSLPTFVIGILFIYLFAVILGILPSFGRGEVVDLGFWSTGFLTASGLKAIILPSVTLSLFQMTYIIRLVRAEMMEILQTDYIKFARARGINEKSIH